MRLWAGVVLTLALVAGAHAAPPGDSGIRGVVTDAGTGEPLPGVTILVTKGRGSGRAETGAYGSYTLPLPPGTYELRVTCPLYAGLRAKGVVVRAGALRTLDIALETDEESYEVVVVEARADRRKEAALLQARKKAAAVSDSIGSQEIARSADSSASDAVKRVVSTTVVDGKYVLIRGLGGRYGATLLNQVNLPSPEPDEQAVPLDLFPTSLLANLTVTKSHSAELPGNFAGGALLIETNSYPEQLEAKARVSLGFDTSSTFQEQRTYGGGSADALGFDDGARTLPADVPTDGPLRGGKGGQDAATLERAGEAFRNEWTSAEGMALPNLGISGTVGGTLPIGGDQLGGLVNFTFSHTDKVVDASVGKVRVDDGEVGYREQARNLGGVESATLGALVNLGYRVGQEHELGLFSLFTHQGEKRVQVASGFNETDAEDFESTRLQFLTRMLSFSQLRGEHRFPGALDLSLRWQGNVSVTQRDEPDTRDSMHHVLPDGRRRFKNGPGSGERFFSELEDLAGGGGLQLSLPLDGITISAGGSVQAQTRDFGSRRFRFSLVGDDVSPIYLPIEEMLSPEHIGPSFRAEERTLQSDAYGAALEVFAGFTSLDITAGDPVRIIPGVRYEVASQRLTPGSPFAVNKTEEPGVDRTDSSWLPSLNVVLALTETMNLRAAYGYTLARPQFRELAPFLYFDFVRRRSVSGNPDLLQSRIHNADLRWEWFPSDGAVVSASVFFKQFEDPIERVILSASQGDVGFANAPGAIVVGGEIEGRATLGFIDGALSGVRVSGNLTVLHSEVTFGEDQGALQTSKSRPLQGQSPFVVNVGVGWSREESGTDVSLLYNVFGKRIVEVGFDQLPDVTEEPVHRLDLTASQRLGAGFSAKLSLGNLAWQPTVLKQGNLDVMRVEPAISGSLALEWAL